jgi:hypothetical protein
MALIELAQAAAEIGSTERWLADQLRAGRFPGKKIGRKWKFSEDDVRAILQICSVTPSAFTTDTALCVSPSSSMTKTTRRRLQQTGHPGPNPTKTAVNNRGERNRKQCS